MGKIKKKRLSAAVLFCLLSGGSFSQAKSGLENYNQLDQDNAYLWMPILHYQSHKGLYAEFRYNYEEAKTASVFLGKTFESSGKKNEYTWTPMIGFSAGIFKGASLALNAEIGWKRCYISSQMQYSHSFTDREQHFYFNWSEAGYEFSERIFTGIAMQYTLQAGAHDFQPGLLAGLNIGNFSIPLYLFRPFSRNHSIILGLNYEYRLKPKRKTKDIYLQ